MIVRRVLDVVARGASPDASEMEIVVLRHQLAVLRRQVARPRYTPADRMLLATLAKLLPRERWPILLITPATLLRWHRQLVARHSTYLPTHRTLGGNTGHGISFIATAARHWAAKSSTDWCCEVASDSGRFKLLIRW